MMREVVIKIELLAKNRDPIKEQEIFERLKNGQHSSDFQQSCFIVAIKNRYLEMAKFVIENPKVIKSLNSVQKTHLFTQQRDAELPGLPIEVTQKILTYTMDRDVDLIGHVVGDGE